MYALNLTNLVFDEEPPVEFYIRENRENERLERTERKRAAFTPKKVVFSGPATIVIFEDGVKVVCKCRENGYFLCIIKRLARETGLSFHKLCSFIMPKDMLVEYDSPTRETHDDTLA